MHSSAAETCRQERFCERVHGRTLLHIHACVCGCVGKRRQRACVCKRIPRHPWMRLQAYTQRPWQTRTLPCVKLRTIVSRLPTLPMVRLDTNPLQAPADTNGISGGRENVCICTSPLLWWTSTAAMVAPCCVINEGLIKSRIHLWSLRCTIKAWVCIMHMNFNFPFKLGPKVGLHIIQQCVL